MSAAETANAQGKIPAVTQAVKQSVPAASKEADQLAKASEPGAENRIGEPKTEITQTAEQMNAELEKLAADLNSASANLKTGVIPFDNTSTSLSKVAKLINSYVSATKKTCTAASEKAGFLCLEGTSPGMQKAKTAMDVAGPALALINSAQKSCSATADVTRLIGTGLTIAKGVCVASKLYCDFSCSRAVKELAAIQVALKEIPNSVTLDLQVAVEKAKAAVNPSLITTEAKNKVEMSRAINASAFQTLAKENAPTPGTSPGTVVKCQGHMKDIGLLAANIAGTFKAQQNAKECADKLKTGGDGPTVAEYCAQPANVVSSYCKCQRDNSQQGCAGHLVTSSTLDRLTDDKGSLLRNAGGASAFAGPSINGVNANIGNINSPINTGGSNLGNAEKIKDPSSAATGGYGGGSGSGSSLGSRGGDTSSGSEAGSGEEKDKKKWSFGAFTSGFGSFGGGSGSAKDGTGSSKMGQKNLDAVRAIASERQWRAEVTASSGKSNFEKVRESYLKKTTSLLDK